MHEMLSVAFDDPVVWCVFKSVMHLCHAKMDEWMEVLFWSPWIIVLDGCPDLLHKFSVAFHNLQKWNKSSFSVGDRKLFLLQVYLQWHRCELRCVVTCDSISGHSTSAVQAGSWLCHMGIQAHNAECLRHRSQYTLSDATEYCDKRRSRSELLSDVLHRRLATHLLCRHWQFSYCWYAAVLVVIWSRFHCWESQYYALCY